MSSKLREALKKCMELGKNIDESLGSDESTVWNCRYERSSANSIVEIAKEALAEPIRNYEVGTAEEQEKRFTYQFCRVGVDGCSRCKLNNLKHRGNTCGIHWSQMPYAKVK